MHDAVTRLLVAGEEAIVQDAGQAVDLEEDERGEEEEGRGAHVVAVQVGDEDAVEVVAFDAAPVLDLGAHELMLGRLTTVEEPGGRLWRRSEL